MPNIIEEFAAHTAGKVGALAARVKGLTGVFNKLAEQHKEASALLKRASMSHEPEKRRDLWRKIRVELLSHERAELREVYPAFQSHPELETIAQQHDADADELEATIQELDVTDAASDAWGVTLKRLIDRVVQHAREEEDEFFPRAQEVLGKEQAELLEQRYLASQEAIKEQLS
jgi:hypothetical protein